MCLTLSIFFGQTSFENRSVVSLVDLPWACQYHKRALNAGLQRFHNR